MIYLRNFDFSAQPTKTWRTNGLLKLIAATLGLQLWFEIFSLFFIFCCGPFLKSLLNLLQYCFCFMFWCFDCKVCGILAPHSGIKPAPPALEGEVLTSRLPGKFWDISIYQNCLLLSLVSGVHLHLQIANIRYCLFLFKIVKICVKSNFKEFLLLKEKFWKLLIGIFQGIEWVNSYSWDEKTLLLKVWLAITCHLDSFPITLALLLPFKITGQLVFFYWCRWGGK